MQSIEKNLPSGVKVVINVDRRLPIACVAHLFGVGYVHEPDHLVGISHFLEHLCFKRSSVKNLGQLINDFRSIGAVLEAGTAYDHTYFSCLVPSQNLSSALRMQSEMVRALDFSSDEIESEKEVVMHELDQKLDQPSRYLWEKLLALSFEVHPIKRWRMGQKSQILSITAEDVVAFHRQHYQPENLVISVVGNVNPEQVIEEISLMYPGDRNDRKENTKLLDPFQESPQTQARLARYEGKLSHALIQLGFKAPSFSHKDQVAMECLHVLLGKEKQSRLYESLVRKELAFTVDTSYFSSRDVGFVAIKADVTPSKMSILEEVIFLELDRLCRHSPSLTELNSAKKMILSSWANEKEDLHNTTYKLAYMKLMEQVSKPKKDYDQLERLQVQDISRVAQEYLTFSQANIVEYVPDESGPGAFPQWRIESLAKRIENQKTKDSSIVEESTNQSEVGSANEGFEEIFLATRNEKESTIFWEDLHIHQLSFGAQLIHLPKTHTATGFISLGFPGGRLHENQKNAGITNFMLQCCAAAQKEKQNTGIPKSSIHQNLDVEASADFFYASTETFHCEFESSLEQLIETLKCRDFSPHVIENQKLRNRLTTKQVQSDLLRRSIELYYHALYGTHPYGLYRYGDQHSIDAFSEYQLQEWYDDSIDWSKAVFVVMSSLPKDKVITCIEGHFCDKSYVSSESKAADILPVFPSRGTQKIVEEKLRSQTGVAFGVRGCAMNASHFYVFEVLRNVLAGMGGRLHLSMRELSSLAYQVTSFNLGLRRSGAFFAYASTKPKYEDEVIDRLRNIFSSLTLFMLSESEFEAAKHYAMGSFLNGLQRSHSTSYQIMQRHFYGIDLFCLKDYESRIQEVSRESVREVARQTFSEEKYALGIVRGKIDHV